MERKEGSARRIASWWNRVDGPDAGVVAFWRGLQDGVLVVKAGVGEILEANDAMGRILGLSRETLRGQCVSAFVAPGEADADGASDAAAAGRGGEAVESRWFHRDGRMLTLEVSRTPWKESGIVVWICRDVTARKDREMAIQARGERLDSLLNSCPAVIYTCRASGDFGGTFVSNNVERLLGYRAVDFVSNPRFWVNHVHPDDRGRVLSALERLSGEESHTDEYRFLAKDGRYVWLRDQVRVIRDAQGRPNELLGFLVDVTARREAELALEASAKRHRELIAGVPGIVYRFSTRRGGIYYSPQVETVLGYSPTELCAKPMLWQQSIHPDDLPQVLAVVEEMEPGRPFALEYRIRDARGQWRWFSDRSLGYRDEGGDPIIEGLAMDITERKRAEEEIRKLSRAVEQSPVSVVITDPSGAIEYVNPKFSQVTGYSMEEVRGKNPRVLKGDLTPAHMYRELWETIAQRRVWQGELHNRKKNGDTYWESACISAIQGPTGEVTHYLAVKEDITQRRTLEEALRQTQKLESVGQLAGGVAHDFNNLLASMMMHLGLLRENPSHDAETVESLDEMMVEAKRAANLTSQLLMFSRRSVLALQPLNLNDLVSTVLKMLGRLLGENIQIQFEPFAGEPTVAADAGLMEQVLVNLAVNARDAMPRGGTLRIRVAPLPTPEADTNTAREEAGLAPICLSVADTGVGMDAATRQRIFEPFFTTKERGKGTGLGLATVHGIVAQHKGWVEVESVPGNGTVFRVFLPAMPGRVQEPPEGPPPAASGGRETILLVEDEPGLRRAIGQNLRRLGYRVLEAGNAREAMAVWQEHPGEPDLLFTDMVMSERLTGAELAEALRGFKSDLKVVLTSGYSAQLVQEGNRLSEGVAYLPKPFQNHTLAATLRKLLDPHRPEEPAGGAPRS